MESTLTARIVGFVATVRANGIPVGLKETADALRVAECLGVLEPEALRWGWRGLLCGRAEEWNRFDALFDSFWQPPNRQALVESRANGVGRLELDPNEGPPGGKAGPTLQKAEGAEDDGMGGEGAGNDGASATPSLEEADFRTLADPAQARAIEGLIRHFARRMRDLATRRARSEQHGRRLDLRRTLRRGVGTGGTLVHLEHLAPRRVRPRLVLLLDVSRSMSLYSFFYLRVARALAAELSDIHVFLYHTHLTQVSDAVSDADPWRAQERLQLLSAGWAGGTRIGECLASFNRDHAGRLVHSRTAMIFASDGYDTGEAGLLAREMATLKRRARRIVWLNPLKGSAGYQPSARGMREALPFLDLFAAAHDLASLERTLSDLMEVL